MKLLHYLKYFLFHIIGLTAAVVIMLGGEYISWGVLAILTVYMIGDLLLGDDKSNPKFGFSGLLTFQLWLALPLLCLIMFNVIWSVSPGDPFGYGAFVTKHTGYDVIAARDNTFWAHYIMVWLGAGLMIGMIGTITAHELTHRTWDPVSMFIGRWLLAFSFDTNFAIEHVYGHHIYVGTKDDPATAPRGRNVYTHVIVSTIKGNISAWKLEAKRLQRQGYGWFSIRNSVLRGYAMSLVLLGIAYYMGGWKAVAFFVACGLWGKALLEIVNYMEHYGVVRDPKTPVQPYHSWNTNRRMSSWSMFNLTRHSHHHAEGEVPYHDLKSMPEAPLMVSGYLNTIILTLIPPLWQAIMVPKLLAWDRDYASPEERELAAIDNARSGLRRLAS